MSHYATFAASLTDGSIIIIEGTEGGNVSFQSSHKLAWNSPKYLCNDPCKTQNDILVTVAPGRRAESQRIALVDFGNGSFTVTFTQLQLSDSRTYWCGVVRPGLDTYTKVLLTVQKGKCQTHFIHFNKVNFLPLVRGAGTGFSERDLKRWFGPVCLIIPDFNLYYHFYRLSCHKRPVLC